MTVISQEHLDALDLAIASGELSVSYQGRSQSFQTTSQMLQARAHIARLLRQKTQPRSSLFGGRSYGLASFDKD